jgi:hypothetical protein
VSRLLHIKVSLPLVFALALAAGACGGDDAATAPSAPAPAAGTDTFTGQMAPGGTAMHQFIASAGGTVNVTLTTTDPAGTLVGLGIGIPGNNVGACDLTKTVQARPGTAAQLSATVDAGDFCAGAFDVGGLSTRGVLVTYTVAHP